MSLPLSTSASSELAQALHINGDFLGPSQDPGEDLSVGVGGGHSVVGRDVGESGNADSVTGDRGQVVEGARAAPLSGLKAASRSHATATDDPEEKREDRPRRSHGRLTGFPASRECSLWRRRLR